MPLNAVKAATLAVDMEIWEGLAHVILPDVTSNQVHAVVKIPSSSDEIGGHAIRRNVAAEHRAAGLRADDDDGWRAMYDAARAESLEHGDFAPYWIYPGAGRDRAARTTVPIEQGRCATRVDAERSGLYRLAFGQPRQEDMLELLRRNGISATQLSSAALDLRPDGRRF